MSERRFIVISMVQGEPQREKENDKSIHCRN
jgi:hypothetical protein